MPKTFEDYLRKTGKLEASGRYYIKNEYGYLGKYQMGVSALMDAGYYKGNKDSKNTSNVWDGEWTGKDGINSVEDYLNNPKAQDKAVRDYTKKQWEYLMSHKEVRESIGKEINGITITPAGLLAGAHLKGHVGVAEYITSNGKSNQKDKNGTTVESRLKAFEDNYDVSEITGIPHVNYAWENHKKKYGDINKEYTPKAVEKNLKSLQEKILQIKRDYNEKYKNKKSGADINDNIRLTSTNIADTHNNYYKTKYENPAPKYNNFEGVKINGKNWKDWNDKERADFIEGFDMNAFTDEGIKQARLQEKNWIDKFDIGNPDTDKGHWITLPNGKHLFIKDKNIA